MYSGYIIMRSVDLNMSDSKVIFHVILNHSWKKELSACAVVNEICSIKGERTVDDSTARQ